MKAAARETKLLVLLILSSLFLLNDFAMIQVKRYIPWLMIDYGTRLAALAIIVAVVRRRISSIEDFGLRNTPLRGLIQWAAFLTIIGIVIDQAGWRYLEYVLPDTHLMSIPQTKNVFINVFDLTAGLALVSVSEELIFRGYFLSTLRLYTNSSALIIILSSITFGLIHWSMGIHAILSTALWGVLPMVAVIRTGSIYPAIIAHYLTDLVSFTSVIPERWFAFIKGTF